MSTPSDFLLWFALGLLAVVAVGGGIVACALICQRRKRAREREHIRLEIEALRERDPDFDAERFCANAGQLFYRLDRLLRAEDLQSYCAYVSDGLIERTRVLTGICGESASRGTATLDAGCPRIHKLESGIHFDTVHLCMQGARTQAGTANETSFTEYWSFRRRRGVRSAATSNFISGRCPSCGASLRAIERARCANCDSVVNSAEHDWVLSEITIGRAWFIRSSATIPGYAQMSALDPGFSLQHVEDRAAVIFVRALAAAYHRDLNYLLPMVWPAWLEQKGALSLRGLVVSRSGFEIHHVGVTGIEIGEVGGLDRLRIFVKWRGDSRQRRQILHLTRRHGTLTSMSQVFQAAACLSCGAPTRPSEKVSCAYCGTALNDGAQDWLLAALE